MMTRTGRMNLEHIEKVDQAVLFGVAALVLGQATVEACMLSHVKDLHSITLHQINCIK
jgi:hypothetical protein